MLIYTQDRNDILNFKNIIDLYIRYRDNDNSIYCNSIYCDTNLGCEIPLGTYETKERCKEILIDILNGYQNIQRYKYSKNDFNLYTPSFVYFMPEK